MCSPNKTIVIPKGTLDPNKTNIIEIPQRLNRSPNLTISRRDIQSRSPSPKLARQDRLASPQTFRTQQRLPERITPQRRVELPLSYQNTSLSPHVHNIPPLNPYPMGYPRDGNNDESLFDPPQSSSFRTPKYGEYIEDSLPLKYPQSVLQPPKYRQFVNTKRERQTMGERTKPDLDDFYPSSYDASYCPPRMEIGQYNVIRKMTPSFEQSGKNLTFSGDTGRSLNANQTFDQSSRPRTLNYTGDSQEYARSPTSLSANETYDHSISPRKLNFSSESSHQFPVRSSELKQALHMDVKTTRTIPVIGELIEKKVATISTRTGEIADAQLALLLPDHPKVGNVSQTAANLTRSLQQQNLTKSLPQTANLTRSTQQNLTSSLPGPANLTRSRSPANQTCNDSAYNTSSCPEDSFLPNRTERSNFTERSGFVDFQPYLASSFDSPKLYDTDSSLYRQMKGPSKSAYINRLRPKTAPQYSNPETRRQIELEKYRRDTLKCSCGPPANATQDVSSMDRGATFDGGPVSCPTPYNIQNTQSTNPQSFATVGDGTFDTSLGRTF